MFLGGKFNKGDTEKWSLLQLERMKRLFEKQIPYLFLLLRFGQMRDFNLAQRDRMMLVDDLDWLAIAKIKDGAQSLMAARHLIKGILQRRDVQLAAKRNS